MSVGPKQYQPSARELFPYLREKLLASRPVIEPAKTVEIRRGRKVIVRRQVPAVFGAPTFRNVIENGKHV